MSLHTVIYPPTYFFAPFSFRSNLILHKDDVAFDLRARLLEQGLNEGDFAVRVHADCGDHVAPECGMAATVFVGPGADISTAQELYELLYGNVAVTMAGGCMFEEEHDMVVVNRFAEVRHADAAAITTVCFVGRWVGAHVSVGVCVCGF